MNSKITSTNTPPLTKDLIGDKKRQESKNKLMGILELSSYKPEPESREAIESKAKLYSHYKHISNMLVIYIEENGGMEVFFGDLEYFDFYPDEDSIKEFFDNFFTQARSNSIDAVKKFFFQFPELLDEKYDSIRYKVGERIERSASNVHFVSLFYLYCYLKQYK